MVKRKISQKDANKFFYAIISILVLFCASLILYIFHVSNNPKQTNQIVNTQRDLWKIFNDDVDNYTISYPQDLEVDTGKTLSYRYIDFRHLPANNPNIPADWVVSISETQPNPQNLSLNMWVIAHGLIGDSSPIRKTTIGGQEAVTWTTGDASQYPLKHYAVKQTKGILYILVLNHNEITKKMIESIKFD